MGISAFGGGISRSGAALIPAATAVSGRRWAVMGDSISANGGITGTQVPPSNGFRTMASNGYINWLKALSLGHIDIQPDGNFSVAGRTTAQIAAVVAQVVQYRPNWVIVEAGTNDPGNSLTTAQSLANLKGIYDALTAAGINILAICVTPRGGGSAGDYTTAQLQQLAQINQFIRRYAATRPNMVVADPRYTVFTNQGTNLIASGMSPDGLHPNQAGSKVWGDHLVSVITPFIDMTAPHFQFLDSNDTYATGNPNGNMLTNSLFTTTTGGTLNGSSLLTGTAPGSWTINMTKADTAYTGTIAASNAARSDTTTRPGKLVRITAAALVGNNAGSIRDAVQLFQQQAFPAGLAVGDVCETSAELFISATAGFNGFDINIGMSDGNGTTTFQTSFGPALDSSASWPQGTYHLVITTPRMTVGPAAGVSTRQIQGFVNLYFDTTSATGTATAVIDIASLSVRKINGLV